MVAINKFILLAIVGSVLVATAHAGKSEEAVPAEGSIHAFSRKLLDSGSNIMSHVPLVGRFFNGNAKNGAKNDEVATPTEATPEESAEKPEEATEETPKEGEESASEETQAEASPSEEAPASEEESKADESKTEETEAQTQAPSDQ